MTDDEAERILKRIVDTWPGGNWSVGTMQVWRKELREHAHTITGPNGTTIDIAKRTYDNLKRNCTSRYGPTVGDWHNEYVAATPRPEWQPDFGDEPVVTPDQHAAHIAAARQALNGYRGAKRTEKA